MTPHSSAEAEARAAALAFREQNRLGTQPLGDLMTIIEQATGVDVAVLEVGPDEHGMVARSPRTGSTFMTVARTTQPMRQRSSLAHELAHVIFQDWERHRPLNQRDPLEVRADAFSRHLLIPESGIHDVLGDRGNLTESDLSAVVQLFQVSPAIAAIALHQAGYIDEPQKRTWMNLSTLQLAIRHGWADQYRSLQTESNQPRAPRRLLTRAIEGYAEGVLSVQAIATLRGLSAGDVEQELSEAGIEPRTTESPWDDVGELPPVAVDLSALDNPGTGGPA